MTIISRGAADFGSWINGLSGMSKALFGGGGAFVITGLPTILTAIVSAFGIGDAPLDADLQKAIVDSFLALAIGVGVYVVPNTPASPTVTKEVDGEGEFEVVNFAVTNENEMN